MKALFTHDHRFIPVGYQVYSEVQFESSTWERYLRVFDELLVVARQSEIPAGKQPADLRLSSRSGVSFQFVPNLSSPIAQLTRRRQALEIVDACVSQADAVIARLPSEIGLLAINAAQQQKKPWAVEMVDCPWDGLWNYGNWQGKVYAPIMAWRTRQVVAQAPFALYVTNQFLQRRYPCHAGETVASSNVEIPVPLNEVLMKRLERIEAGTDRIIFGLIGTLRTRHKGIQTVLAALEQKRDRLPPFEFRVLGGGDVEPWQDLARRHSVRDVTYFDGTLPSGEPVLQWLDKIDIYLHPSFKEGLPRALIEAMSRGCPAIASTVAGIPELLEPDCLIRPGDTAGLGRLLQRAAEDTAWQQQQALKNWTKAGEYSRDTLELRRQKFWERFAAYAAAKRSETKKEAYG